MAVVRGAERSFSDEGSDSVRARIDAEAADWLGRIDRGLSDEEDEAFIEWLERDARHGECLQQLQETWSDCDHLSQWRPEFSSEPNEGLLAPSRSKRQAKALAGRSLFAAVAALLALSVGIGVWLTVDSNQAEPIVLASEDGSAGYQRHVLEDGSVVEMNAGSEVEVLYEDDVRRLTLRRGEAHFIVARDASRPFLVSAAGIQARALGTAFNVLLSDADVEVMVTRGKVRVASEAESEPLLDATPAMDEGVNDLVAGQKALVSGQAEAKETAVMAFSLNELSERLSWRSEILEFSSTPLDEVVDAFNERNYAQLVIVDKALFDIRINAAVNPGNIDGFLRMLQFSAGIKAERTDSRAILLRDQTGSR